MAKQGKLTGQGNQHGREMLWRVLIYKRCMASPFENSDRLPAFPPDTSVSWVRRAMLCVCGDRT